MQISLLIGILLPLILAPLATRKVYEEMLLWERQQITLDNAAIVLGRGDRETLNYLDASNRLLAALEIAHHPFHLCARIPAATAACVEEDVALEEGIRELHRVAGVTARGMWRASFAGASALMVQNELALSSFEREEVLPLESHRCPLCHLETSWSVEISKLRSRLTALSAIPMSIGTELEKGSAWQYRLKWQE